MSIDFRGQRTIVRMTAEPKTSVQERPKISQYLQLLDERCADSARDFTQRTTGDKAIGVPELRGFVGSLCS